MNAPPMRDHTYVGGGRTMTVELAGRDRFKFFRRPVVPVMDATSQTHAIPLSTKASVQRAIQPHNQILQAAASQRLPLRPRVLERLTAAGESSKGKSGTSAQAGREDASLASASAPQGSCEAACQTMYRENDCQTDPYTPSFFVEDGQQPEVLAIMELKYGEGLPAGLAEVEMIDRVQRRKKVEQDLPQGSDDAAMHARLEALEKLEATEWEEREAHIKNLQEARLKQMDGALQRREVQREEHSLQRVDQLKQSKLAQVEQKLLQLQEKRLTVMRKLKAKHVNPCCEKKERNVIEAHVLHGSRAAPVASSALVERVSTNNYDVRPTLLSFNEGVQELERTKVPKLEAVKAKDLQPPQEGAIQQLETNYQKRKARTVIDHLEYASKVIDRSHEAKEHMSSVQDLYRATPRLQRPDTPTMHLTGDDEEVREEAVLLLQRLLRGRAMQNDFFEGKERCHGLIEELQAASAAKESEQLWLPEQQRELFHAAQEAMVQSVIDGVQGDVIFGTLDYLFKELLRQQDVAKIEKLRDLAEATRKEREEAETQRRGEEQLLRRKEDEQYARLVESADCTVSSYLNQLFHAAAQHAARTQAVNEEVHKMKPQAEREPHESVEMEELVCDMLDQFIIPHACSAKAPQRKQRLMALSTTAIDAADELAKAATSTNQDTRQHSAAHQSRMVIDSNWCDS